MVTFDAIDDVIVAVHMHLSTFIIKQLIGKRHKPDPSFLILIDLEDGIVRKTVFHGKIFETIAIEAAYTIVCSKPHIAFRILFYLVDFGA